MRVLYFIRIVIILSALSSCKSVKDQQFKKEIIGEWKFDKVEYITIPKTRSDSVPPIPICDNCKKGYNFYENQKCEDKLGYFKKTIDGNGYDRTIFIGTRTDYKIEDELLKIFDLRDSTWRCKKIISITGDSMRLQSAGSNYIEKFVKTNYSIDSNEQYDKIIYSSSFCDGSCPALNISVGKDGNVFYWGRFLTTKDGLFTSKISEEDYSKIEMNFKKAGIKNLEDNYEAHWTDDQTISITFITNGKIVKTISDYGRQAPTELYWAYLPLSFLYQNIQLVPFTTNTPGFHKVYFKTKYQVCELTDSESFYLTTELYKGKEVKKSFKEKYSIDIWGENDIKTKVYTDGRYYRFTTNKKTQTVDLGYNFLTRNGLTARFRNKPVED